MPERPVLGELKPGQAYWAFQCNGQQGAMRAAERAVAILRPPTYKVRVMVHYSWLLVGPLTEYQATIVRGDLPTVNNVGDWRSYSGQTIDGAIQKAKDNSPHWPSPDYHLAHATRTNLALEGTDFAYMFYTDERGQYHTKTAWDTGE